MTTNQEKLEKLLEPPTRSGRLKLVERPPQPPRKCAVTGRWEDDYFIDLGVDTQEFMGQIYLCAAIVGEIAKIAGYVPKADYIEQIKANEELIVSALELSSRNQELEKLLNDLVPVRGGNDMSDVIERIGTLASEQKSSKSAAIAKGVIAGSKQGKAGFAQQGGKQGFPNISGSIFTDEPTI